MLIDAKKQFVVIINVPVLLNDIFCLAARALKINIRFIMSHCHFRSRSRNDVLSLGREIIFCFFRIFCF